MQQNVSYLLVALVGFGIAVSARAEERAPDFTNDVAPILQKYCAGCHNSDDPEGGLALDSFTELEKGGDQGPAVLAGQAASSRLIRMLRGELEPKMPPEDNDGPSDSEIAVLAAWIDAGARGPSGQEPDPRQLRTPRIEPAQGADERLTSFAFAPDGTHVAVGRFGEVELRDADSGSVLRTLSGLPGKVNRIHFSRDGRLLVTASGIAGLYGQATLWDVDTGRRVAAFTAHRDTLYDAELSPDALLLVTCSYDHEIIVWDVATGAELRRLEGHNGAVFDLAFHPDGKVLASASADETVKLWRVDTGQRLDTLSQPGAEQYVVRFTPDGQRIVAAGADNRIRVWDFVSRDEPRINPLLFARFAHEQSIIELVFSADGQQLLSASEDRTIKLWEAGEYTERHLYEARPAQVIGLAFRPTDSGPEPFVAQIDNVVTSLPLAPLAQSSSPTTSPHVPAPHSEATVDAMSKLEELEPNNSLEQAMEIPVPANITGRISPAAGEAHDADLYRFTTEAGLPWVLEINAARNGSPLDSYIEVLDEHGRPIERVLLQAVRDSYFQFRGKDSNISDDFRVYNWEEMELNEYLYAGGEVVKLWLYPRGPDSGFKVYPGTGKRYTYFDTTAVSHALGEPCYIVEPHAPRESLIPNGLPVFPIYFENDDDSRRRYGADSRLTFTAPRAGTYLVRVTDARGFGGPDYHYELTIRPRQPDFTVTLAGTDATVSPGGAREFSVTAERLDDFEGPIRVEIDGLPPGFHVTSPVIIEEGQNTALGLIYADADAPAPTAENAAASKVRAIADVGGRTLVKDVNSLGTLKLGEKSKVAVRVLPADEEAAKSVAPDSPEPWELVIRPGTTVTAKVRIERNGYEGHVVFGREDSGRNLPHGVYVDNIGLNGLMILEGQNERTIFITAAKGVAPTTRLFHLLAQVDGNQASWPVLLRVEPATE